MIWKLGESFETANENSFNIPFSPLLPGSESVIGETAMHIWPVLDNIPVKLGKKVPLTRSHRYTNDLLRLPHHS